MEFAERIRKPLMTTKKKMMVNFDVVSLFIKIPIDETVYIVLQRLKMDNTVREQV